MKLLLMASAVGPLGGGHTGGVSDAVVTTIRALTMLGHEVTLLASEDSIYNGPAHFIGIAGKFQQSIVVENGQSHPVSNSLIQHYWEYAKSHQHEFDAIINFCHDWLPYHLTPRMQIPVLHRANVADEDSVITKEIQSVSHQFPGRVAVLSKAQAASLGIEKNAYLLQHGLDIARYPFSAKPVQGQLLFSARISPEKGLHDAAEIASRAGKKLIVCGFMQDASYSDRVCQSYPGIIDYRGFLPKEELVMQYGQAEALLCTHHWVEAFGLVVIEALACGTPVITYDRGGPTEVVKHGATGFVVSDLNAAIAATHELKTISRQACRNHIASEYDLPIYSNRIAGWLNKAI